MQLKVSCQISGGTFRALIVNCIFHMKMKLVDCVILSVILTLFQIFHFFSVNKKQNNYSLCKDV